jgi:septal ring factor EnvC (AmiA/AmiB activator)
MSILNKLVVVAVVSLVCNPAAVLGAEVKVETGENPMRRIITMLQDMSKEVEREGEAEKEIFEKALCACEGGEKELDKTIVDSQAGIEEWTSKTESAKAESAQLTQEVADHKTSAEQAKADLAEGTTLRDKEHKEFVATEKDSKTNLDGLAKAIPAIEKGMGGAALMQLPHMRRRVEHLRRYVEITKYLTNDDRSQVLAFLDEGDDSEEDSETHSQGAGEILGILKNMKDEMEKDLSEMQAQEKSDHEAFNELKASKEEEISINEKAVISKEKRIGALALELSEGTHALEDAQEELANAEKFKATMKEQCAGMEKQKAAREKARADEIKAISEAVGILNDDDALETFSKAKPSAFVQKPRMVTYDALLQLTRSSHRVTKRHQVKNPMVLLTTAVTHKIHRGRAGPPADENAGAAEKLVVHMISGMVGVMHDEDVGDEHKKAWCANETEVQHEVEAQKKDMIEKTEAEISEQEDLLETTISEIKGLTEKIQELDKMVHETTANRKDEHQEFVDMFATSTTAIRLVNKAIKRLEKFYSPEKFAAEKKAATDAALAKAGLSLTQQARKSAALVQSKANDLLPGGFDFLQIKSHSQSMSQSMVRFRMAVRDGVDPIVLPDTPKGGPGKSESGGVMGLMNEFVTDLKMEMTEAETSEKFNAKEYVRIMTEAQETRKTDTKSLSEKKAVKATLDTKLVTNKELLELTEEELHNLELYLVQVHTECDFLMRNFEARHEDRVEGETGLESAETIVTDAEPPSHKEIEDMYKAEKTDDDVDEHFPGTPIDDGPDKASLAQMRR